MVLYDMRCPKCGDFEVEGDISVGPPKTCPDCDGPVERTWEAVAAYHNRFSPMHPRVNRGKGVTGVRKQPVSNTSKKKGQNDDPAT